MVQFLLRSTFNNIEHQSIQFVKHSLMPWLIKIEMAIIKDVLVGEEQRSLYPKFNVDGLLRGDFQSRMNGYRIGINSGIYSFNEVRDMENLDPMPAEQNGDEHVMNGSYIFTRDIGKAYGANAVATRERLEANPSSGSEGETEGTPPESNEEALNDNPSTHESPAHAKRKAERRAARQGSKTSRK